MPEDTFKELHELRERVEKIDEYTHAIQDRMDRTKKSDVHALKRAFSSIQYYIEEIKGLCDD